MKRELDIDKNTYLMKNIIYLLSIFACIQNFAQSSKSYTLVYIVNKSINKGEYIADKKVNKEQEVNVRKLIYGYNAKKDTITYYSFYNSVITDNGNFSLYTLDKKQDTLLLRCKGSYEFDIKLKFDNQEKTVTINGKDVFYLNDIYYHYLDKNINEHLKIPDLVDFLEDFLEDYGIQELKEISSHEKYKHNNFKIIKAYMESYRSQAPEYVDRWNIKFEYDKNGRLKYLLKESTEGDNALEKKMISYNKDIFRYKINRNNESRLITDSEQTLDISNKTYHEKMTAFQVD